MNGDRPAVVLVHGAWHGGWCWERVVPLLEEAGVAVHTVELPSVGASAGSGADLSGDAAAVRATLDTLSGRALLCGHSYGGMVISLAGARHANVRRLVYLCAFMPDDGQSLLDIVGEPPQWIQELEGGLTLPDLDQAPDVFYGDCDDDTVQAAVARIRPMSGAPFAEAVPVPAWHDVPSTYVVCAEDAAIPPELQRDLMSPRAQEVVTLQASHSPFFSQPEAVAEILAARSVAAG